MNPEHGPQFIENKYPDTNDKARPRLNVIERFSKIKGNQRASKRLEELLLNNFVLDIDNEQTLTRLAKGLYESEKRVAIERGHGAQMESLNEQEILVKYREVIVEKEQIQRKTLSSWFEYIKNAPEEEYPMWFKYYVVRSLKSLGQFSRDEKSYANRTIDTIAPFPELNQEALGFVKRALIHEFEKEDFDPEIGKVCLTQQEIDTVSAKAPADKLDEALKGALRNKKKNLLTQARLDHTQEKDSQFASKQHLNQERKQELEDELARRLRTKDFAKLYAFAQVECAGNLYRESLEGEWIKYDKGSDYTKLENALKGKGTGWCTAEGSAQNQLQNGDFYVFYTNNKAGIPTEPRIAIRMENDSIAEIRGVNPRQELEPELVETAKEKYKDLPGAQRYEKADADMKKMTTIFNKSFSIDKETKDKRYLNPELTKDELRFLYQVDSKIQGFGYVTDPRIQEVVEARYYIQDLSLIFDCRPDQISATKKQALSGDIVFHYGDLDLSSIISAEGLTLPTSIGGYLDLSSITSAEGLTLPTSIGGGLELMNLPKSEKQKLRNLYPQHKFKIY